LQSDERPVSWIFVGGIVRLNGGQENMLFTITKVTVT
jgi:hypothetical protein